MPTGPFRRATAIAARLWLLAPLALTACEPGVLNPRGKVGIAERSILIDSLAIMLCIVVPVIVMALAFPRWYRDGNPKARYAPDWAYSGRIELIVWGVPLLTITLLGGVAWIGSHQLDPARPLPSGGPPLNVQVVSMDWKWLFLYPDLHIATVNQLYVPAGVPVHFALTSSTVMNVFFVPQLGSEIYTMNGMATQLWLDAQKPGDFRGISAHFSGDGFPDMHFRVHAIPDLQFDDWVRTAQASTDELDEDSYNALNRQSGRLPPRVFKLMDVGLFDKIVRQDVPPGPGPDIGRPNGEVMPTTEH